MPFGFINKFILMISNGLDKIDSLVDINICTGNKPNNCSCLLVDIAYPRYLTTPFLNIILINADCIHLNI